MDSGSVRAAASVSLAAQGAWLRHGSVRENVLFGAALDAERYQAVLRACALLPDLACVRRRCAPSAAASHARRSCADAAGCCMATVRRLASAA